MNEAKKYDNDKVRMELVPMSTIESVAKILTFGAKNILITVGKNYLISGIVIKEHY